MAFPADQPPGPAAGLPSPVPSGHPPGLLTLFLTEMWERLGYYGMRALLVLFMVDAIAHGGLGLSDVTATAIYGLYTAAVYLAALPGGWVADQWLGARRSVWCGGVAIASGYFLLAVPRTDTFYLGLLAVVIGSGLLKPNISALVGQLYPEGGARRDAGFTWFYMGINVGAALGPLLCSTVGQRFGWRWGFATAGLGMLLGLLQLRWTGHRLGTAGLPPPATECHPRRVQRVLLVAGLVFTALIVALWTGWIEVDPVTVARGTTYAIVLIALAYFGAAFGCFGLSAVERRRLGIIVVLFLAAALFWAGFEQTGSTFNLFADRYTRRQIAALSWTIPAGYFQSLGAVFVIVLAPLMAALWVRLAARRLDPAAPVKFALGLLLLASGFAVMIRAAQWVAAGAHVGPVWLVTTYFLHSVAELCLSPVGLSTVTQLAPRRLVSQMLGVWFLASSLGNLLAGLIAGGFRAEAVAAFPAQYLRITLILAAGGLVLLALAPTMVRRMRQRENGVSPRTDTALPAGD